MYPTIMCHATGEIFRQQGTSNHENSLHHQYGGNMVRTWYQLDVSAAYLHLRMLCEALGHLLVYAGDDADILKPTSLSVLNLVVIKI